MLLLTSTSLTMSKSDTISLATPTPHSQMPTIFPFASNQSAQEPTKSTMASLKKTRKKHNHPAVLHICP
jgi:hypothetical protein